MAISEVAMEILYIVGILKFLGTRIKYPFEVNVNNIGAVYVSKKATTGNCTEHIDTRYHFVREHIEESTVNVFWWDQNKMTPTFSPKTWTVNCSQNTAMQSDLQIFIKQPHPRWEIGRVLRNVMMSFPLECFVFAGCKSSYFISYFLFQCTMRTNDAKVDF